MRAEFIVAGTPAPKGSRIPGHRRDGTIYTRPASKGEKPWTEAVAYAARATGAGQLPPPYEITLTFHMPEGKRPKWDWPSKADGDKLERAVFDGLVQGGLILDDRHVIACTWRKEFGTPHLSVTIA